MGQPVMRGGDRLPVRNDYRGSQESWVPTEPFVLANDVAQVFYVKDISSRPKKRKDKQTGTSYDEPKRHIVLSGKRNIVGMEDKTEMSEYYNKFDEIPPFKVKTDPSIVLYDENCPWLRRSQKKGIHTKKK